MAIRDLTVKERILLHLFDFNRFSDEYEAPLAVTQSGIAKAVGIRVQHVTQYVKPMVAEEVLEETTRHIRKKPRRQKVYFLTPTGRQQVASLRGSLLREPVDFRRKGGELEEMPLARVYQEERRGARLVELVTEATASGHIVEVVGAGTSGRVDFSQEAPPVDRFYGREAEIEAVSEAINQVPLTVVTGIAGIGKTTLGSELCKVLRQERSLLWTRVRRWQTATDVAFHLGGFLNALGRPKLLNYLGTPGPKDLGQLAQILTQELPGEKAMWILDDVHTASEDAEELFSTLLEVFGRIQGWSALLLSRATPAFYSRREVEIEGSVVEVHLEGLDPESGQAILADAGISEELVVPFIDLAGGSPLFLKLLAKAAMERGVAEGWDSLDTYIAEEIEPSLLPEERSCLQAASFYEFPVPSGGLMLERGTGKRTLVNLQRKGFLDRTSGRRYLLHDSLRTYFFDGLSTERRRSLTAKVVEWLTGKADELTKAGKPLEAIRVLENALSVEVDPSRRFRVLKELGRLRMWVGDFQGAIEPLTQALEETEDPEAQALVRCRLALSYGTVGRREEASAQLEEGLRALPEGASAGAGLLLTWKAYFRFFQGDFAGSWALVEEVLPWQAQFPTAHNVWWRTLRLRGWLHTRDGSRRDLDAAQRDLEASLKELKITGRSAYEQGQLGDLGTVAMERGLVEEALAYLARAIEQTEKIGTPGGLQAHLVNRGGCFSECVGDQSAAEVDFGRASRLVQEIGWRHHSISILRRFPLLYWRSGRFEEARETMAYFLEASKEFLGIETETEKPLLGRIGDLALMVRYCAACGDADGAGTYLDEMRDLAKETETESNMVSFFSAWAEGVFRVQWGNPKEARPFYEQALGQVAEAARWEHLLLLTPSGIVGHEFLLDYGRVLASSGEREMASKVFMQVAEETQRLSRAPLAELAKQELSSLDD